MPRSRHRKHRNKAVRDRIFEACRGRCAYCQQDVEPARRHLDHVVPISWGGPDTDDNLTLACRACNCAKHAHMDLEWIVRGLRALILQGADVRWADRWTPM